MKIITWLADKLAWRKSMKSCPVYDLSVLDEINTELENTVTDTSNISRRIIQKLEDKVEQIEGQLSDREKLLETVFNTIPAFLCLKDNEGKWKLLNSYGKQLYGIEGNSYKEKYDDDIAEISPRYRKALELCKSTDQKAWELGSALQFEEHTVDSFGRESVFDVTKLPIFNLDGSKKNLLVLGKNVTEELNDLKHIKMLGSALNHASDSICITDHEYNIIYANKSFCDTHEMKLIDKFSKHSSFSTSNEIREITSKGLTWSGVMNTTLPSGKKLTEDVTITPILNGKPYPIYYIGVKRLVDRRKSPRS